MGEVLRTYIIAEQGERVILIDKHAAHERLVFDALKARGREILSQGLIVPQTWRPGRFWRKTPPCFRSWASAWSHTGRRT